MQITLLEVKGRKKKKKKKKKINGALFTLILVCLIIFVYWARVTPPPHSSFSPGPVEMGEGVNEEKGLVGLTYPTWWSAISPLLPLLSLLLIRGWFKPLRLGISPRIELQRFSILWGLLPQAGGGITPFYSIIIYNVIICKITSRTIFTFGNGFNFTDLLSQLIM